MKKLFVFLITIIAMASCSKPFPYKYQEKEQSIKCANIDSQIIHEALYSFKEDISRYYLREIQEKDYLNFSYSYAQYIYRGTKGDVNYIEIASPHTIKVFDELVKEEGLFVKREGKSNLNYNHDFVICLINNFENKEMKNKILNLIEVDYLSPEVMAENYRIATTDADTDPNFLMFIALDTYYQRFLDLDFTETN